MPRYFFHSANGGVDVDDEGTELPDDRAARTAAIRYAGEMLTDQPDVIWDGSELRVQVTNEAGALVSTIVTLAVDTIAPSRRPPP